MKKNRIITREISSRWPKHFTLEKLTERIRCCVTLLIFFSYKFSFLFKYRAQNEIVMIQKRSLKLEQLS